MVSLTTNPSGIATYLYKPATNLYYRSVFAGAPDLDAVTSNMARTVVRQLSVLRSKYRGLVVSLVRGTTLAFTTTVRPARRELPRATVRFAFYRLVTGGRWRLYAQRDVATDSLGRATASWNFRAPGQWSVRSQARPTPYNANSVWSAMQRFSVR
jgi:hypothetical protein